MGSPPRAWHQDLHHLCQIKDTPLLQEPDSSQNKELILTDPRRGHGVFWCSILMAQPYPRAAWRGAGKVGAQALHPHGETTPGCAACATTLPRVKASALFIMALPGSPSNSVIDLPLFSPRGHIEVQCKICWSLNSFQVMAHVSGNKSMCRKQ